MKHVILEPLPVSASGGFLFRGLQRLTFCVKVLITTGSFMRVSTEGLEYWQKINPKPIETKMICLTNTRNIIKQEIPSF